MRYILLALTLLFAACDKPATPKIAEPQRDALEKAKGVEQIIQKSAEETEKKTGEATQ